MPAYPGPANGTAPAVNTAGVFPPFSISPGDVSNNLFNAEQPAPGTASDRVALHGVYEDFPGTLSVEGFFSGAPGAFEIDLQTADVDADAFYTQEGNGITAVSAGNGFHAEFNVSARFARVFLKSRTNAVNLTVYVTRH